MSRILYRHNHPSFRHGRQPGRGRNPLETVGRGSTGLEERISQNGGEARVAVFDYTFVWVGLEEVPGTWLSWGEDFFRGNARHRPLVAVLSWSWLGRWATWKVALQARK